MTRPCENCSNKENAINSGSGWCFIVGEEIPCNRNSWIHYKPIAIAKPELNNLPESYIPPMETLPSGGKQAKEPYNYALLPKEALHLICLNMTKGAEVYGKENYLNIPYSDNASRAVAHLQLATMTENERKRFSEEDTEKHLINGATRALFALDCYIRRVKAQAFYDGDGAE